MNDIPNFKGGKMAEGMSLWESPITQISTQLEQKMREEEDKLVVEVSQTVGYDINKEELIKALNYSKEQFGKGYAKGYARAVSDFAEKMKQSIMEQSDWECNKAFYIGMIEGVKIFLESEKTDKPKHEIGCYSCPNVGHFEKPDCMDAYTEKAHLCNLYDHKKRGEQNDGDMQR